MKYEFPKEYKMSKEEEQASEKLNTLAKGMAKNFLNGLFFFFTLPFFIYRKIKNDR